MTIKTSSPSVVKAPVPAYRLNRQVAKATQALRAKHGKTISDLKKDMMRKDYAWFNASEDYDTISEAIADAQKRITEICGIVATNCDNCPEGGCHGFFCQYVADEPKAAYRLLSELFEVAAAVAGKLAKLPRDPEV